MLSWTTTLPGTSRNFHSRAETLTYGYSAALKARASETKEGWDVDGAEMRRHLTISVSMPTAKKAIYRFKKGLTAKPVHGLK